MNPFNYLKYGNRKIYQFSPVRTGSTLVYNILKEIFPRHQIVKSHKLNTQVADNASVVVTYRHPLDSLASTFQALDLVLTEEELEVQVKRHKERGLDDLVILWNHPNVLKLKYEAFYNDFGVIFNGIEQFFDLKIQDKKKSTIVEKYQISIIEKATSKFRDFREFDKKTHWHGRHISGHKGRPGYHQSFFSEKQLHFLKAEFKNYLQLLGYG